MDNTSSFLVVMAMLSTSSQTLTDHVLKMHIPWLDDQNANPRMEALRSTLIHLIAAGFGALLTGLAGLHPLRNFVTSLGTPGGAAAPWWSQSAPWVEYVFVGLMVSYGSSFFNEALDLLREIKLSKEQVLEAAKGAVKLS